MPRSKNKRNFIPLIDFVAANAPGYTNGNPLALSRKLSDMRTIVYPDGIAANGFDLDEDAKRGLVRYDRDFLLQFMPVCKQKPETLPPLEDIGLVPKVLDPVPRGGSGRHRQSPAVTPHQGFGALGTVSGTAGSSNHSGVVKSDAIIPAAKLTSEERFAKSNEKLLSRSSRVESASPACNTVAVHNLPTVVVDSVSPETVRRAVKTLLKDVAVAKLNDISGRIIHWANTEENGQNGRTLKQIIHLVVEKATDNNLQPEISASLCKKMMKNLSPRVQDDSVLNGQGKVMRGKQLFRRHLHDRCLSDIHRGWATKETVKTEVSAARQSTEDECAAAVVSNSRSLEDGRDDPDQEAGVPIYINEDQAARQAKRQCFGIIKFIGELAKQHVLKKRTVHECLEIFLAPINPDEEDIESFCMLLSAGGEKFDTGSRKFDRYIMRMNEWIKNPNVAHEMQNMLRDLIVLRERKWISDTVAPVHVNEVHQVKVGALRTPSSKGQVVVAQEDGLLGPIEGGNLYLGRRVLPQSIFVGQKDVANTQRQPHQKAEHNEDGCDAASGMSTMIKPPESVLVGESTNVHHKHQSSEEKTLVQFLERLVGMKMCSTALVPADERQGVIESIVADIALQAPDALRKLSLMVRGEGLD